MPAFCRSPSTRYRSRVVRSAAPNQCSCFSPLCSPASKTVPWLPFSMRGKRTVPESDRGKSFNEIAKRSPTQQRCHIFLCCRTQPIERMESNIIAGWPVAVQVKIGIQRRYADLFRNKKVPRFACTANLRFVLFAAFAAQEKLSAHLEICSVPVQVFEHRILRDIHNTAPS